MFSLKAFLVMSRRRKTTEQFIEEARKIHGDLYGYELVDYKTAKTKVLINCKVHGVFEQLPSDHLQGSICRKCSYIERGDGMRMSTNDFISKCISIHGETYDYSMVDYKTFNSEVKIICMSHGVFYQLPSCHFSGYGCPKCGIIKSSNHKRKTKEYFVKKAKEIHVDRYDYGFVKYINNSTKVIIKCKQHGNWSQTPSSHFSGHGCPKCGVDIVSKNNRECAPGWNISDWESSSKKSKNFDSFKVYIIRCWNDDEEFYKIGRTFLKTSRRFYSKKGMPYNYEILNEFIFDNARECFNIENELKRLNKLNKYLPNIPFGGMHECFSEYPALE